MKDLKSEIRLYIAEKLLYWAICVSPEILNRFLKKEETENE